MRRIIILLFMLVFISTVSAFADELVLEKGKGVEVCESYQKSLQGMSLQDMICGEKTGTETIKRPKWERLELKENKELVKKIEKFLNYGDQFAEMKIVDDEKEFEHYLNGPLKNSFIRIAEVDIANNGKPEKVLLYHSRLCKIERRYYYARPLLVLDEVKNLIDVKKTEPLLQNIPESHPLASLKNRAMEHIYRLYDVFFYKKSTYFDKWFIRDWTLTIYEQSKGGTKEICKYKYILDEPLIKEDY